MNRKGVQKLWNVVNVSISKSRKAQLHEKSFSWFEGIGAFSQQAKKAVNDERTSKYMEDQEKWKIQNMMISFTDYRNDYLKRINLEV